MEVPMIRRVVPHSGDLGMSGWVACEACCRDWTALHPKTQAGWFAIPAGTPHFLDPVTRWHFHADCVADLQARDAWTSRHEQRALAQKGEVA